MATHSSVLAWRIPGTGSLVGCRLWGRTASDTTEATQQQQRQKYSEWSSCLTGFLPANKSCSSQTPFQHREWQRAPPNQKGMNMPHPHPICKFTAPQLRTHFYGKVPQAKSSKDCWRYGGWIWYPDGLPSAPYITQETSKQAQQRTIPATTDPESSLRGREDMTVMWIPRCSGTKALPSQGSHIFTSHTHSLIRKLLTYPSDVYTLVANLTEIIKERFR